jgi:membrane-associated phospholipid phosphatase
VFLWLGFIRAWRTLITWAICFCTGAAIVAATKVAYAGWGIEIQALHFTVVSGHTMLASAVYPTVCAICATHTRRHSVLAMFLGGLAFALLIGVSRWLFHFHSMSEVVTGMLVGTAVATVTCLPLFRRGTPHVVEQSGMGGRVVALRRDLSTTYAAIALAIVVVCHGRIAPVSIWIDMKAPHWQQTITTKLDDAR